MHEARPLDANINRAAEGIRVLEDIARFHLNNQTLSAELRALRHSIRDVGKGWEASLLSARDAAGDVGITSSFQNTYDMRRGVKDSALSNFKRVQEACRSLEELLKATGKYDLGKKVETIRYAAYTLEQRCISCFTRKLPLGIYGILGEKFSCGRTNAEVARQMVTGGIDILQYREKLKDKSLRQIFEECSEIRKITADAGVPFIINDYADIALMVEADGIHQGQDDLPIADLRKIAPHMMLGCSTHSPEQAQKAIDDGADYIGVGPIFTTQTKEDVCDAVGLGYLEHVVSNHTIDFVAIGGIKRDNIEQVVSRGAKTVCLVTEIIGADNLAKRISEIREILVRA